MALTETRGFDGDDAPNRSALDRCVRCGLCLPACPTYLETGVETSGPRGRIALIDKVAEGTIDVTSAGFIHQMHECLGCGACETACPSGVGYGELLATARTQVERAAPIGPPASRFLRGVIRGSLFERPRLFRALARCYAFFERTGLLALARGSGILRALGLREIDARVPALSSRFFVPSARRERCATLERKATVQFHAGCLEQIAFAETCEASLRTLRRAGCDIVVSSGQVCCGAWALAAGLPEKARALARANVQAFERTGADVLVSDSAGCGAALKGYRDLLAHDDVFRDRAAAFSARVRDATELLDELGIAPELGPIDLRVTYVDPCRLVNGQRVTGSALRLLARIPGLVVRVPDEAAICCGGPGAYSLRQPEMSDQLAARKLDRVLACAPNAIVTADSDCARQLTAELHSRGRVLPVRHVVDLLDDSYAAYRPTSGASSASAASTVS